MKREGLWQSFTASRAKILFVALAAVWLLLPAFRAQHLEGYTANLEAIARAWVRGDPWGQDLFAPSISEFLYYTRPGFIALLALIDRLFGEVGDAGFRTIMVLSLVGVIGFSLIAARKLSGGSTFGAILALLLTPGVSECAFIFNDNMASAALAIGALALVASWDAPAAYVLTGCLLAVATSIRIDAILFSPAILGAALMRHPNLPGMTLRAAAFGLGFVVTNALLWAVFHSSLFDAIFMARSFLFPSDFQTRGLVLSLFFGLAGGLVLIIGVCAGAPAIFSGDNRLPRVMLLLVFPGGLLAFALFVMGTELRYLYPLLTPFIAIHGGAGIDNILQRLNGGERRSSRLILGAVVALCICPPIIFVRDGPHALMGRVWMPAFWSRWQDTMAGSVSRVEALAEEADQTPRMLVVSTHFNDEFLLKEKLLARGFSVLDVRQAMPGCEGFAIYRKGEHMLAHVRTENQYGMVPAEASAVRAVLIANAFSCPYLADFDTTYLTTWGMDVRAGPLELHFDPRLLGPVMRRLPRDHLSDVFSVPVLFGADPIRTGSGNLSVDRLQGKFLAIRLSTEERAAIRKSAERLQAAEAAASSAVPLMPSTILARFSARCDHPPSLVAASPFRCWR